MKGIIKKGYGPDGIEFFLLEHKSLSIGQPGTEIGEELITVYSIFDVKSLKLKNKKKVKFSFIEVNGKPVAKIEQ
jgi:hypothetical protein